MSRSRRRFQQLALVALGGLLVVLGGSRLRAAVGTLGSHHEVEHRVERVHHSSLDDRVEVVRTATGRDVLYDESFRVREGGRLVVDLGSENVTVRTVSGNRARVRVEGRGRDAEREFERRRFSARADDGRLTVATDPPRRRFSLGRMNASFEVTIEVPRRFDLVLDLGSGNVEVGDLRGDLAVDVGSGNVSVGEVQGDRIVLDTGSGNVRADRLRGVVRVDTGSGSVRIDRVDGELVVDTGSGSVEVGLMEGPAVIDTGSGSVEIALSRAARTRVDTGSGSATVRVPRRAGFNVDLDGGSVRIDEALDFRGERERNEARGRIGGGGPSLVVDTGSGQIRLEARR